MRKYSTFSTVILVLVCAVLASPICTSATAQSPNAVGVALDELDKWLNTSKYGPTWRGYLRLEELRAELAKGDEADRGKVKAILQLFEGSSTGLSRRRFQAVRGTLKAWSDTLSLPRKAELPDLALSAKQNFDAITEEDVAAAQKEATAAARDLNSFLSRNPSYGRGWKDFLKWKSLEKEVSKEEPNLADVATVLRQLSTDSKGLEKRRFRRLRYALRRFLFGKQAIKQPEGLQRTYEGRLDRLAEALKSYGVDSRQREANLVADQLAFFQDAQQAPEVVESVRRHYSHPNLLAYIKEDIATAGMKQTVSEPLSVRESIMGTFVVGSGMTNAFVNAKLTPNNQRAVFNLSMNGVATANTTGYNRKIRVFSSTTTQLNANKSLYFAPEGFTSSPADAHASASTRFTGLRHAKGRRMIEKIAWKKAYQRKGSAEREASRRARGRLQERFDEQASEMLTKANDRFRSDFRNPLVRKDAFPDLFDVHTDREAVRFEILQATSAQLGAPQPPVAPPAQHDMAVRVHESFINNFVASALGGVTLCTESLRADRPDVWDELVKLDSTMRVLKENENTDKFQQRRKEKVEARRKAEGRPQRTESEKKADWFAITLAKRNPITVEFRENHVRIIVRATRFVGPQSDEVKAVGPGDERDPLSVIVVYDMQRDKYGGLSLTLGKVKRPFKEKEGGEVQMLESDWVVTRSRFEDGIFPDAKRLGVADTAIIEKLNDRLRPILVGENGENRIVEVFPLELPGRWSSVGELAYTAAEAEGGWLTVAWDRMGKQAVTSERPQPVATAVVASE